MHAVCLIRFEVRLSEAFSASVCTTPSPTQFHCDGVQSAGLSDRSFVARLQRLNSTRFAATASSYVDEQPVLRQSDVDGERLRQRRALPSGRTSTDAALIDFGFVWIVFLTLDAFLVTRRIGNFFALQQQQQQEHWFLVHGQVTIIFVVSVCLFVQSFSEPSSFRFGSN